MSINVSLLRCASVLSFALLLATASALWAEDASYMASSTIHLPSSFMMSKARSKASKLSRIERKRLNKEIRKFNTQVKLIPTSVDQLRAIDKKMAQISNKLKKFQKKKKKSTRLKKKINFNKNFLNRLLSFKLAHKAQLVATQRYRESSASTIVAPADPQVIIRNLRAQIAGLEAELRRTASTSPRGIISIPGSGPGIIVTLPPSSGNPLPPSSGNPPPPPSGNPPPPPSGNPPPPPSGNLLSHRSRSTPMLGELLVKRILTDRINELNRLLADRIPSFSSQDQIREIVRLKTDILNLVDEISQRVTELTRHIGSFESSLQSKAKEIIKEDVVQVKNFMVASTFSGTDDELINKIRANKEKLIELRDRDYLTTLEQRARVARDSEVASRERREQERLDTERRAENERIAREARAVAKEREFDEVIGQIFLSLQNANLEPIGGIDVLRDVMNVVKRAEVTKIRQPVTTGNAHNDALFRAIAARRNNIDGTDNSPENLISKKFQELKEKDEEKREALTNARHIFNNITIYEGSGESLTSELRAAKLQAQRTIQELGSQNLDAKILAWENLIQTIEEDI